MDLLSTEQLRSIILHYGFHHQSESSMGQKVDEISERGFPFKTEEGLALCKANTFDNEVSSILIFAMELTYVLARSCCP